MFDMKIKTKENDFFPNKGIKVYSILNYFQDAATDHAILIGLGYDQMIKDNMLWVVLRIRFDIYNDINYLDEISIETWPEPKSKVDFGRSYLIKDNQGNVLIRGKAVWVVIDSVKRKIVRSSEVIRYKDEYTHKSIYDEPIKKLEHIEYKNYKKVCTYKVKEEDIDLNGHMNNTKYAKIVFDSINVSNRKIISGQIDFINEARLNDLIDIYVIDSKDKIKSCGIINDKISFELDVELKGC